MFLFPRSFAMALNSASHGLDQDGVLDALQTLHARGWIEFVHSGGAQARPDKDALRRAVHARERGLPRLWYGLTEAGGRLWERYALPRWDRFVTVVEDPEAFVVETTAMTRERVAAVSDFPQFYEAIPGSDEWDELAPWPATYWKALPQGVRLRRRMRPLPQEEVCPRGSRPPVV